MDQHQFYLNNESLCRETYRRRKDKKPKDVDGRVVYAVLAVAPERRLKIGTTTDLERRLTHLLYKSGPMRFVGTISGGFLLESQIHRALSKYVVSGNEWFDYRDDVVTVGKMIREKDFLGLSRWLDRH